MCAVTLMQCLMTDFLEYAYFRLHCLVTDSINFKNAAKQKPRWKQYVLLLWISSVYSMLADKAIG